MIKRQHTYQFIPTKDPQTGELEILEETEERGSRMPIKRRSHKTNNNEQNHSTSCANFDLEILNFQNLICPFGLKHGVYTAAALKDFRIDEMGTNGGIGGGVGEVALINVTKTEYQYKYNAKEWQDELGLNMYAMDMRQYDPAIARWVVQDPVTHFDFSPYNAFDNNPVFWADPSGADAVNIGYDRVVDTKEVMGNIHSSGGLDEIDIGGGKMNNSSSTLTKVDNKENKVVTSFEHRYEGTNSGGNLGNDIIIYNQSIYDKNGFMMQYTTSMIIINEYGDISSRSTTVSIKDGGGKWQSTSSDSYAYGLGNYATAVSDFKSYDQTSPLQYQAKLNREYNQKEGNKNHVQNELIKKVGSTAASFIPRIGTVVSEAINLVPNNAKRHEHVDDLGIKVSQEGSYQATIKFR